MSKPIKIVVAVEIVLSLHLPSLDIALTPLWPYFDLYFTLPWRYLDFALTFPWPFLDLLLTLPWPCLNHALTFRDLGFSNCANLFVYHIYSFLWCVVHILVCYSTETDYKEHWNLSTKHSITHMKKNVGQKISQPISSKICLVTSQKIFFLPLSSRPLI